MVTLLQHLRKFFQEPVTIVRTFLFPLILFVVLLQSYFSLLLFYESNIKYSDGLYILLLTLLNFIFLFWLPFKLFKKGLAQVEYFIELDNLGIIVVSEEEEEVGYDIGDIETYKIIRVREDQFMATEELSKEVNKHMRLGWRLAGGQSTSGRNPRFITQAMERDLPEEEPEIYVDYDDYESDWRENRAKELGIYNSESCTKISAIFKEIYNVMLELSEDDLGYPGTKFFGEEFGKEGISWHPDSKTDNPAWLNRNIPEYEIGFKYPIYSLTHAMNCYWGNDNYFFLYAYFDPFKINWKLEDNNEEIGRKNYNLEKWRKGLDASIEDRINGIITENLSTLENYYEEYIQMKREKYDDEDWEDRPQWFLKNPESKNSGTTIKRLISLFDYYSG